MSEFFAPRFSKVLCQKKPEFSVFLMGGVLLMGVWPSAGVYPLPIIFLSTLQNNLHHGEAFFAMGSVRLN